MNEMKATSNSKSEYLVDGFNTQILDNCITSVDVELGYDMRGSNVDNGDGGQVGANMGGFVDGGSDDDGAEKGVGFDVVWVVL
ncbi:hypothetical protein Peur_030909 [Populus x canadensis]